MEIKSRTPGMVMAINVKEGDAVKAKDIVVVMEAMKMKQNVPSPVDGVVKEIKVKVGDRLSAGNPIMVIE